MRKKTTKNENLNERSKRYSGFIKRRIKAETARRFSRGILFSRKSPSPRIAIMKKALRLEGERPEMAQKMAHAMMLNKKAVFLMFVFKRSHEDLFKSQRLK